MSEVEMRVIEKRGPRSIRIEPPLTAEKQELIKDGLALLDIPKRVLKFPEHTSDTGKPFTEIDCERVRTALEAEGRAFDDVDFATKIADIMTKHGEVIMLEQVVKPA